MALEIKENRGVFEISGRLTAQNLGAVRLYFESILETKNEIEINLEKASCLDGSVNQFFQRLANNVSNQGKVVSILHGQPVDVKEEVSQNTKNS